MKKYYKSHIPWIGGVFLFEQRENKIISTYFSDGTPFCLCSFEKEYCENKDFTTKKGPCPKCNIKCEKHVGKYGIQANPDYLKHSLKNKITCAFCQLEKTKKIDVHVKKFLSRPYPNIPEFSFIDHNDKLIETNDTTTKNQKNPMKQIGYWCGEPMIDPFDTFKLICAGEEDVIIKKTKLENIDNTPNYNELADTIYNIYTNDIPTLKKTYKMLDSGIYSRVGLLDNNTVFKIEHFSDFKDKDVEIKNLNDQIDTTNKAANHGLSGKVYYHKFFEGKKEGIFLLTFMERIMGIGFIEYYTVKNRSVNELETLFHDVASRIIELHSIGLVHGDMAGRNIILSKTSQTTQTAMFIDFTYIEFFESVDNVNWLDLEGLINNKITGTIDERKEHISKLKTVVKSLQDLYDMLPYAIEEISTHSDNYPKGGAPKIYLLSRNIGHLCVALAVNLLTLTETFGVKDDFLKQKDYIKLSKYSKEPLVIVERVFERAFKFKKLLLDLTDTIVETENKYKKLMERDIFPISSTYKRVGNRADNIIEFLIQESFDKTTKRLVYEPYVYMIITILCIANSIKVGNKVIDVKPFVMYYPFL